MFFFLILILLSHAFAVFRLLNSYENDVHSKYQSEGKDITLQQANSANPSTWNYEPCGVPNFRLSLEHEDNQKRSSDTFSLMSSEAASGIQKIVPSDCDVSLSQNLKTGSLCLLYLFSVRSSQYRKLNQLICVWNIADRWWLLVRIRSWSQHYRFVE